MNGIFEMHLLKMKKEKILDFKKFFKHRLSFNTSKKMDFEKRAYQKLHYDDTMPSAVPYVTSYYKNTGAFVCLKITSKS